MLITFGEHIISISYENKKGKVFVRRIFHHICLAPAYKRVSEFGRFFIGKSHPRLLHGNIRYFSRKLPFIDDDASFCEVM